jgi:hypothetical protein
MTRPCAYRVPGRAGAVRHERFPAVQTDVELVALRHQMTVFRREAPGPLSAGSVFGCGTPG